MQKKVWTVLTLSLLAVAFAACGKQAEEPTKESQEANAENPLANISEEDVVSEEDVEIGGQEMTTKTLKDGSKVNLPKGMTIDEAKKLQGDGNLSATKGTLSQDE